MATKSAFKTLIAKSLSDYLSHSMKIRKSWETKKKFIDPWFRGLSSVSHTLLPGWYRLGKRAKGIDEDDLQDEFQRRAVPLLEGRQPQSLWEWSFLMQHYGLPTRLLDWSESSLVGLYFAVGDWQGKGGKPNADAVVWMLDPWYLNQWSKGKNEVFRYDRRKIARYFSKKLYKKDRFPKKPIALMPHHNNRRLTAQRGVFTMHGKINKPLEVMLASEEKPRLVKIVIPKKHILKIREEIQHTGISDIMFFPEMPYLCQDIMKSWELAGAPVETKI